MRLGVRRPASGWPRRPGPALGDEAELDRALRRYARRHRKALTGHDRVCSAYSSGRRFNPAEKLLFRAAARDDELAGRFALFGERWIKPRQLLTPSMLGLMLRANLGRGRKVPGPPGRRRGPDDRYPLDVQLELVLADADVVAGLEAGGAQGGDRRRSR